MIPDELNDEQRIAVEQDGHVLLTACPGSGKTRVIINKLAYEVSRLPKDNKKTVVAVTFTIRASDEIFRRLAAMGIDDEKIWAGTLHSFCLEWILRPYSCYLEELKEGFGIADETFCSALLAQVKEELRIDAVKEIKTSRKRDGAYCNSNAAFDGAAREYHKRLRKEKLIDFDLLLYYSYRLLLEQPRISRTLSNLFTYICIDEFQDTQDLLYAIFCTIARSGCGRTYLYLVGDADQAIYTSLGGIAKSLEELKAELGEAEITPLTLSGNYRSNQRIIDFYSQFQNQPIKISAVGENAINPGWIEFNDRIDKNELGNEIARIIRLRLAMGLSADEIAVLVPQWRLVMPIARTLRRLLPDVDFDASGMTPMSRNRENLWYKVSRLFLSEPGPRLHLARHRWSLELIDRFSVNIGHDLLDNVRDERHLLKLINSIKCNEEEGLPFLRDCFDQFLQRLGIELNNFPQLKVDQDIYFEALQQRLDNDSELPTDTASFKRFYKEMTGVVINTCVGVKGEEFDTVIAFGLLYGYVPHWSTIIQGLGDPYTEARKMLYVICSRAKENLYLYSETGRETRTRNPYRTTEQLNAAICDYDS